MSATVAAASVGVAVDVKSAVAITHYPRHSGPVANVVGVLMVLSKPSSFRLHLPLHLSWLCSIAVSIAVLASILPRWLVLPLLAAMV